MNPIFRLQNRLLLFHARFRRGMTLGVRAAILDADGRVFLVRHSYTPGWYLPGGGVEPGETIAAALEREMLEEGGIVPDGPAEMVGLYLNRSASARDHVALFACRSWRRVREPRIPNIEIVDCGFFPPDALPEGATAATRRRLDEILRGAPVSQEW